MHIRAIKYALPFIIYFAAFRSFTITGWMVWIPLIWAWILIPLVELFARPSEKNLDAAEEEMAKSDRIYDIFLYLLFLFYSFDSVIVLRMTFVSSLVIFHDKQVFSFL